MGIIKSADTPISVAAFSMQDIEAAARNVIRRAQRDAEKIVAAARTESIQIKADASTQGMAEGNQLGLAQGTEEGKKT
jgi:flagellar biosynthesis/type III secretory pathway protein FliH